MIQDIEFIEAFLKKNIQTMDLIVETKPSITGFAVIYRASIDKVDGGNFATSGYEYSLSEAFKSLVEAIKEEEKK